MKNKIAISLFALCLLSVFASNSARATELKVGDSAPLFKAQLQDGSEFDLHSRKGQWTVLYFYPKAGTPGCTKQACAFRDSIEKIRKQGADVFGISADSVEDQAKFHKEHHLNFSLIADPEDKIVNMYGSKMPLLKMSKRWTFILDPELKIRTIEKDVDPAMDAEKVAGQISALKVQPKLPGK